MAKDFAPGLPDMTRYGSVRTLPTDRLIPYVVQAHKARRAGLHNDIRFGPDQLFSWATKKEIPKPGERIAVYQQPLHRGSYADFEGELTSGYGAGTVKTKDKGSVLVTKVDNDKISFIVAHHKFPERFLLARNKKAPKTWYLINTTPRDVGRMLSGKNVNPSERASAALGVNKVRYTKVPEEDVEKLFDPEYLTSEKIDGAAALYHLMSDRIEALSYRVSKQGKPIIHTYRVGGLTGVNIPKDLVGTVLRGEMWGEKDKKAIPVQELGGLLNSSVAKSRQDQQTRHIKLRNAIFNIYRLGKVPIDPDLPYEERLVKIREVLKHLPESKFHLPRMAETPDESRALWEDIRSGRNPRTSEGIVGWPRSGGKPVKVKLLNDRDVWVKEIFPGKKRLKDIAAGGFSYSLEPKGPKVGEVGTGFSDATRKQMWEDPESWTGRLARVRSQGQFPSGALRAPVYHGLHEDYPMKSAALWLTKQAMFFPSTRLVR